MSKINKQKQAAAPQKLLHELFDYNPSTGGWVNKVNRSSRARVGQTTGSLKKDGYIKIQINGYLYQAHRLAWVYVYGDYLEGEQPLIDHINGNPSDNRIANLKISSSGENMKNKKIYSRNTSGINGVTRVSLWNGTKTKENWYWLAYWYNENGKQSKKRFSISKLGEEEAKQLAIDFREQQLRLLELNYGITYSDRHGI